MLETTHARDYYLSIAERYPPFEPVIAGDDSLVHWIDRIAVDIGNTEEETPVRLEALCELYNGEVPPDEKIPHESLGKLMASGMGYIVAGVYLPAFAGIAAIMFIPPPLGELLGVPLLFSTPFCGFLAPIVGTAKRWERLGERRKEALQPLYGVVESLDADISRCFILEDFEGCRGRFELTYRSLTPGERAGVEQELCRRLEAGAIDMGEAELGKYLDSLTVSEVAPDA